MDEDTKKLVAKETDEQSDVPAETDVSDDAKVLASTESAIKVNMAKINRAKEDLKPVKEMFKSFLEGDEQYVKVSEAAKSASKLKSGRKRELLETQSGRELSAKIDSFTGELKEAREALSYYLREYQRLTGLNEFEGEDGELRQIVYVAKLVRKTNLNK